MFLRRKKIQFSEEPNESHIKNTLKRAFGERLGSWIWALFEVIEVVVVALALVLVIRTFVVQPFYVKGASMEPSFFDHEYLVIDELTYRFREPQRGEIVVFRYPENPREFFIKRIIGLPNESVEIKGGTIWIRNSEHPRGMRLKENYILDRTVGDMSVNLIETDYFLLGDNRGASLDSRAFGPIDRSAIVGRVWLRGWPPDRIGTFDIPNY